MNPEENNNMNPRIFIGFFYLVLFIIGLVAIFVWRDFVFYSNNQAVELSKIWGRISFIFVFTLLGLSLRAFKWSEIGTAPASRAYFFEYLLISSIATLVIFSGVGLATQNSPGYFFYTLGAPLGIVAGFSGYKTANWLKPN